MKIIFLAIDTKVKSQALGLSVCDFAEAKQVGGDNIIRVYESGAVATVVVR